MSNELVTNPFASQRRELSTLGRAMESREQQEIQAAMAIARRFPRDPVAAMDAILNACTRPSLAEAALYSYNRGGQEVTGPSIRLAEVLAQGWGHLLCGVREISSTDGESTVETYAWDLQGNFRDTKIFTVPHERHTKGGVKRLTDPRDIYEHVANQGARRKRACILAVIPGDVVESAVRQCELTMTANVSMEPEAITKMVDSFSRFGVTPEQIERLLGNRLDAIRPAQVVRLRTIYRSLADGISGPESWFKPAPGETVQAEPDAAVADLVRRKAVPQQVPVTSRPEPAPEPAPHHAPFDPVSWPLRNHDGWVDSTGQLYDETRHGWSASENRPAVTDAGVFRARRGTRANPPATARQETPGQQEEAPVKVEKHTNYVHDPAGTGRAVPDPKFKKLEVEEATQEAPIAQESKPEPAHRTPDAQNAGIEAAMVRGLSGRIDMAPTMAALHDLEERVVKAQISQQAKDDLLAKLGVRAQELMEAGA
jgi:hypothetical protein